MSYALIYTHFPQIQHGIFGIFGNDWIITKIWIKNCETELSLVAKLEFVTMDQICVISSGVDEKYFLPLVSPSPQSNLYHLPATKATHFWTSKDSDSFLHFKPMNCKMAYREQIFCSETLLSVTVPHLSFKTVLKWMIDEMNSRGKEGVLMKNGLKKELSKIKKIGCCNRSKQSNRRKISM